MEQGAISALLQVEGDIKLGREALREAVIGLADSGCPAGFKLACVTRVRDVFEDFVYAEDAGIRSGITTRVFFDEENAAEWLKW